MAKSRARSGTAEGSMDDDGLAGAVGRHEALAEGSGNRGVNLGEQVPVTLIDEWPMRAWMALG